MLTVASVFHAILIIVLFIVNLTGTQAVESVLKLDQQWVGDFDGTPSGTVGQSIDVFWRSWSKSRVPRI
jgi:hypothetical protein